ncbi:ABC transporter, partial [Streptomyces sp. SID10244]|nr:ABC transporter [Streptomyces sp. SID10244]
STLNDALDSMLAASQGGVLVTDGRGAVVGSLTIGLVMDVIRGQLAEVRDDPETPSYVDHPEGSATDEMPVIVAADDEPGTETPVDDQKPAGESGAGEHP